MKRNSIAVLCMSLVQGSVFAIPYGYGEWMEGSTSQSRVKDVDASVLAQATVNVERSGTPRQGNQLLEAAAIQAVQQIDLYPGEVRVLPIAAVERIAIGNGGLVTATIVDEKQVVLLGEAVGQTSMHLWLKNGLQRRFEVKVSARQQTAQIVGELREILSLEPRAKINVVNDKVFLTGDYSSAENSAKVKLIAAQYPQVINLINERPLEIVVAKAQMVLMDVKVVEVRKSALDNLGIKWDIRAGVAGPTIANNALFYSNSTGRPQLEGGLPGATLARPFLSFIGLGHRINSMLNFLETNGDSWTISEPRVSTVSGGKSKVQVGGEVPIPVANGLGAISVVYKEYGVILEIEPNVDSKGNIRSTITAEVSRPDGSTGAGTFTSFITNRTKTEVSLVEGETLVISGLLQNNGSKNNEGVSGLGRVPFLGRLFSNREFTNERTEMLVVVTPRIHNPGSETAKTMEVDALGKIKEIETVIEKRVAE